jgi:hypothetical protein
LLPATSGKNSDKKENYFLFIYLRVREVNRTDPDKPDKPPIVRLCPNPLPDNYCLETKQLKPFVREKRTL